MNKIKFDFSKYINLEANCFIEEPHDEVCKEYFDENKLIVAKLCDVKFIFPDGEEYPEKIPYCLTVGLQRAIDKYGYNKPIPLSIFEGYRTGEIR